MPNNGKCIEEVKHPEQISKAKQALPDDEVLLDTSELFKIMGDPSRMRIIIALMAAELCVCDLAELTEISQSAVSHQLRILRQARLVRYRREGKNAYYSLEDTHVSSLVQLALEHVRELYAPDWS